MCGVNNFIKFNNTHKHLSPSRTVFSYFSYLIFLLCLILISSLWSSVVIVKSKLIFPTLLTHLSYPRWFLVTQWPKDTKGVFRIRKSKDRQHNDQKKLNNLHTEYSFGIFWSLCCLSFLDLRILNTPLVSFGHCVVCPSSIYEFWILLWYLLVIVLSILLWLAPSYCLFRIFCPLCCLSFFYLLLLIAYDQKIPKGQ
jgi:hypothetical protein